MENANEVRSDRPARASLWTHRSGRQEPKFTEILDGIARFGRYSLSNVLLILAQRRDATHVAGYHAWRRMGRYVKAGERPIVIQAPILEMSDDDDHDDGHGGAAESEDEHDAHCDDQEPHAQVVGYTRVGVYDVCQTVGKQVSRRASDILAQLGRLKCLLIAKRRAGDWPQLLGRLYRRTRDGDLVPRPGISPAYELAVLIEFVSTTIMLPGELDGDQKCRAAARAVSCVVLRRLGYSWRADPREFRALTSGDKEQLIKALNWIRETANEITAVIEPEINLITRGHRRRTLAEVMNNEQDMRSMRQ
ncbi:MAG: ArdC-like ssDNA-binding domain-containing protein [Pirellulaceae bacterium]|nr:ArdC-like ssDNA-binding domain-containing protein [Pirellulaceae bacterium]